MSDVYFTSDNHFGHGNILKFCPRPYSTVEEMNEALIENYNSRVKKGDLVYLLGDLLWRSLTDEQAVNIVSRLNGQKYYIFGNHEEKMKLKDVQKHFIWMKDLAKIHPAGAPHIILCHYAMRVWEGSHRGDWHLFGHSHNGLSCSVNGVTKEESALSFDIGVDAWNMFPVSLEEVTEKMNKIKNAAESKT